MMLVLQPFSSDPMFIVFVFFMIIDIRTCIGIKKILSFFRDQVELISKIEESLYAISCVTDIV